MATSIEIKSVRIRRAFVPFRRPIHTKVGLFEKGPFLLIDLETKGGAVGRLPGFTFNPLGLKLVPPVIEHLVDGLKGRSIAPNELPAIHDGLQKRMTLLGHEGVVQMAISMLDMVLYDCMAEANGVPLYRLLGAPRRATPAYNSCGLGLMAPEKLAIEARDVVSEHGGFNHVKMRLGRATLPEELAAIRAVREAVGNGVLLSVDFNQALPAAMALPVCRAIDGLGLGWIEEPVVYDDYETQRRLATKLSTPLQIGENWWSWRVGRMAMEQGACDYVMPDILRIGGVTGWMRLARVAELHAIPFSSHLTPEYSAHVLAATPTAHWLEWMDWAVPLLADPLLPEKGSIVPRDRAGAGITWNEPAIEPLLVTV